MNVFRSPEQMDALFPPRTARDISIAMNGSEVSNSGKAGKGIRMNERTPLVSLTPAEEEKYYTDIGGAALYNSPHQVPNMTSEHLFHTSGPISWDLGAGRGERVIELAQRNPNRHFVGVDIHERSARMGARAAADAGLDNVRFIRADSRLLLKKVPANTADEVGVLFPAPQPDRFGGFGGVLQEPYARDIGRILQYGRPFEFATDSEPYFSVKMRMLGGLGIFSCDINEITQENELTSRRPGVTRTRYQNVWENKGIVTHRAKLRSTR